MKVLPPDGRVLHSIQKKRSPISGRPFSVSFMIPREQGWTNFWAGPDEKDCLIIPWLVMV